MHGINTHCCWRPHTIYQTPLVLTLVPSSVGLDYHLKKLNVIPRVSRARLWLLAVHDAVIKVQELRCVRIDVRLSNLALLKTGVADEFPDRHRDWQALHVGSVKINANNLLRRIDLNMGVKLRDFAEARLVSDGEVVVSEQGGEDSREGKVRTGHALWHADDLSHGGQVVSSETSQESQHQFRLGRCWNPKLVDQGLLKDVLLIALTVLGICGAEVVELLRECAGLVDKGRIGPNNISDSCILNLLHAAYLLDGVREGGSEATHGANHDLSL
ncbi:hypothetical protein CCHR01_09984 [Colletotrichum chrysophilum]|uniref:Uncharacterized protein n=1 Tax=Colletotrichum chrysophilum TaxID=1836956 RepID=A0AAD9AFS5_9PEZI|nr:hypothetical protein CCHR01_09984 [Colletotrichum chrysophilum]